MKLPWSNKFSTTINKPNHLKKGEQAERIAEQYLTNKGFEVLVRNFRTNLGEIDLIMLDKKILVFVEVRLRTHQWVSAIETIGIKKQAKIIKTAKIFLQKNRTYSKYPCRFDVIGLDSLDINRTTWIPDAFQT